MADCERQSLPIVFSVPSIVKSLCDRLTSVVDRFFYCLTLVLKIVSGCAMKRSINSIISSHLILESELGCNRFHLLIVAKNGGDIEICSADEVSSYCHIQEILNCRADCRILTNINICFIDCTSKPYLVAIREAGHNLAEDRCIAHDHI